MRAAILALWVSFAAVAEEAQPPAAVPEPASAATEPPPVAAEPAPVATATEVPAAPRAPLCTRWRAEGLGEGPVALGYGEADVATGRRACPRTEVGLGGRFGAIIDTANFYGNLVVDGLVYGSVAINPKTEVYGTLAAVEWNYVQSSVKGSTLNLGTLTLGAARQFYGDDTLRGSISARLMLPTSFMTPGSRPYGFELGSCSTYRPTDWVEIHGYVGADLSAGLGLGPALPQFGGVLTLGTQLSPLTWLALVVDATGRIGPKSYFAPSVALRFRVFRLGIELAGTLPLAGNDRHDFIAGARFNWRL